jgi:hypothetical protein
MSYKQKLDTIEQAIRSIVGNDSTEAMSMIQSHIAEEHGLDSSLRAVVHAIARYEEFILNAKEALSDGDHGSSLEYLNRAKTALGEIEDFLIIAKGKLFSN